MSSLSKKFRPCQYDTDVTAALRDGFCPAALQQHIDGCPVCTQTQRVAQSLRRDAVQIRMSPSVPTSGEIWQQSQRLYRQTALTRANRIFILMMSLVTIYGISFAAWILHHAWNPELIRVRPAPVALLDLSTLACAVLAALATAIGSWYLLRHDKQPMY